MGCSWVAADLIGQVSADPGQITIQEAVARGFRLLHVDASPASAPILRRCGFHGITASTHYQWKPPK